MTDDESAKNYSDDEDMLPGLDRGRAVGPRLRQSGIVDENINEDSETGLEPPVLEFQGFAEHVLMPPTLKAPVRQEPLPNDVTRRTITYILLIFLGVLAGVAYLERAMN